MIRIDIQPYCDDCLDFTPDVDSPVSYDADRRIVRQSDTIIHCKYRNRCKNMVRYLQKQLEQGKRKEQ